MYYVLAMPVTFVKIAEKRATCQKQTFRHAFPGSVQIENLQLRYPLILLRGVSTLFSNGYDELGHSEEIAHAITKAHHLGESESGCAGLQKAKRNKRKKEAKKRKGKERKKVRRRLRSSSSSEMSPKRRFVEAPRGVRELMIDKMRGKHQQKSCKRRRNFFQASISSKAQYEPSGEPHAWLAAENMSIQWKPTRGRLAMRSRVWG